jgi:hypothetical protein
LLDRLFFGTLAREGKRFPERRVAVPTEVARERRIRQIEAGMHVAYVADRVELRVDDLFSFGDP